MQEMEPPPAQPSAQAVRSWTDIFSNEKSFLHPWVGSKTANRLGLHQARVRLSERCARMRRAGPAESEPPWAEQLQRDGYVVLQNVLPPDVFENAYAEFRSLLDAQSARVPVPPPLTEGFGDPVPNAWGFDRYDGGSLNRFVRLDDSCTTLRGAFDRTPLAQQLQRATGVRVGLDRFMIYQLVHGPEDTRPDLQRQVHCDTFHETYKLWYFFDEVTEAHGAFRYSVGSHRNTRARLRWEQQQALSRSSRSASFRIDAAQLQKLGWKDPQSIAVPANSLVLANTRGFHCRGLAPEGTERASLYANLRPHAFAWYLR